MKKIITIGLVVAFVLSVGATTALAATSTGGTNYADADGNGVCDNIGTYSNFVDENGDGICDNTGVYTGMGRGKNGGRFVDNDGDGENDNMGRGTGANTNQGQYKSQGQGRGRNR